MPDFIINSDTSLQAVIGELRVMYRESRYIKVKASVGKHRSTDQNAISHAWYDQVSRELREHTPLGVKRVCKLHYGVPILRAEDCDFRDQYDATIKSLQYEQKLLCMDWLPVTSLMTKAQLSSYLEAIQEAYAKRGVALTFPENTKEIA